MKKRLTMLMTFFCAMAGTSWGTDYVTGGDGLSISENFIVSRNTSGNVREIWSDNAKMGFNLSQTVELPNGVYTLSMQAMYRASYDEGTATNCVLYAETTGKVYSAPIANYGDYTSTGESLGGVAATMTTSPDNYANKIPYFVVTDGRVNIGARSLGQLTYCFNGYWFIWDPTSLLLSDVKDDTVLANALADVKAEAKAILDEAADSDAKTNLQAVYDGATATGEDIVALKEAIRGYYPALATVDNPIDVSSLLINPKYEEKAMMVATNNTNTGVTYPMVQPAGWLCTDNVTVEGAYHFYHVVGAGETFDGNSNSNYYDGNTLYMRHAWDGVAPVMTAKQTVRLPEGNYRITVPARKNGSDITVTVKYTFAGTTETNTVTADWTEYSKNFTVDATNRDITVELGFSRANINVGTEQAYFGGVTLLSYGDPLTATRKYLKAEMETLEAYRETTPSGFWTENTGLFAKALAEAEALMTGTPEVATVEAMTQTLQGYSAQAAELSLVYVALESLIAECREYAAEDYSIVETTDVRAALTDAITVAEEGKGTAANVAEIESLRSALETARRTFVEAACPASGRSFDMTYKIVNATVASADGWTNGRTASGEQYTGAPDNTYLDVTWGQTLNISQALTNLPEGLYTLKAATRSGNSDNNGTNDTYPVAYLYAGSQQAALQQAGNQGNALGNGWGWTSAGPATVTDGSLAIGLYAACSGHSWAGADNFILLRGFDETLMEAMVQTIAGWVTRANAVNVPPLGTAESAAVEEAVSAAGDTSSDNIFVLRDKLAALQNAIAAAESWKEEYEKAKVPLVAAFERFEQDYNDGANGSLRPMSAGAWATLLEAVKVAAQAKDVTDSYEGFAPAADAFNAAMDAAEPSIRLYAGFELMISAFKGYGEESFTAAAESVDNDEARSSDENLHAAISTMDAAFQAYRFMQESNFSVGTLLGENLDFETTPTVADERNGQAFEIPGWNNVFVSNPTDDNLQWIFKTQSTDIAEGVATAHCLHMRSKWDRIETEMQTWKDTYLPSGEYTLSFYIKEPQTSGFIENLCYYELDGVRTEITAGTSWERKTIDISVKVPTMLTLSFGFLRDTNSSGGHDADIYVDDVELVCHIPTPFARALAAAHAETGSLAAQAAYTEYKDVVEADLTEEEKDEAITVLNNSVTIAQNGENATSLINNADFSGNLEPLDEYWYICKPEGWELEYESWDGDIYTGVVWTPGISSCVFRISDGGHNYVELSQKLAGLPNGVYRFSAAMAPYDSDFNTFHNGESSLAALYGAPEEGETGRSMNMSILSENSDLRTYDVYFKVVNHVATIGMRADACLLQFNACNLEYVGENDEGLEYGQFYQHAFSHKDSAEIDLRGYARVTGADIYVGQKNVLVWAASNSQLVRTKNVIVDGVCEDFELTDGSPFTLSEAFTAVNAVYSRYMTNEWGTLVLPFDVKSDENVQYYELTAIYGKVEGERTMSFTEVEGLPANTPGAFRNLTMAMPVVITGTNVEVVPVEAASVSKNTAVEGWTIEGHYQTYEVYDNPELLSLTYCISNNSFMNATGQLYVPPFRATYVAESAAVTAGVNRFMVEVNPLTEVADVHTDAALAVFAGHGELRLVAGKSVRYAVYGLNGMNVGGGELAEGEECVLTLPAGIYIVNGLKVQVK